jgi:mannose-1-phosphate guanylyltransferase
METTAPARLNVVSDSERIQLKPTGQNDEWLIIDNQTQEKLGLLTHPSDSPLEVELFWGKGGFMAVLLTPEEAPIYFGLPGSNMRVFGTQVHLNGPLPSSGRLEVNQDAAKSFKAPKGQTQTTQAMILGAGLATRFERVSGKHTDYSKPSVPLVGNRSVICCLADLLASHGYTRLLINTYFKPESLRAGLVCDPSIRQTAYVNETEPSGTAGALRKMLMQPEYAGLLDESKPLLVVQGDSVTDADFSALMDAHIRQNALVTMGCQWVADEDVDKFGIIVTDRAGTDDADQSGAVTGFQEKPPLSEAKSRLGNTGFYIFSPQAYPLIRDIYNECLADAKSDAEKSGKAAPDEILLDFAHDVFPRLLAKTQADPSLGIFWAQQVGGYWSDIGNPSQYMESVRDVYTGKVAIPLPEEATQYYRNGVIYWEGTQVLAEEQSAQLSGNVVVARRFKPE